MSVEILEHEPLARYVGWRIGGPARFFTSVKTTAEMLEAIRWGRDREVPIFLLGGGTNILVADGGFPGLVIRNRAMGYRVEEAGDEATLHIASGAPMAGTARRMAGQGLGGLVWAEGLPGTVGGAVYGNAGCYGGDTAGNLVRATILRPDGEVEEWTAERFHFRYRGSAIKPEQRSSSAQAPDRYARVPGLPSPVVLEASLRLHRDDPQKLALEMAEIAAARRSKTPSGSSCGSSFKNPPGTTAGRLLDMAGLKGTRVGGASVSPKHANFIVNDGRGTATDVRRLGELVRDEIERGFGVRLVHEVVFLGDWAGWDEDVAA